MKIAIVGCGALGSYYGAKLWSIGQDVHFLLRSDYEAVKQSGVRIRSVDGDFTARPAVSRTPAEIGICDAVFIGLKTTANQLFPRLLPPLVGPQTAVVTLQNGLGNEEQLAALFPPEQVLGGLCFVCLNRTAPGVIEHTAGGKVVLGEFNRLPRPHTHELATLFRQANIPCDVTDNLARAHWEKLIWNIPFNGLGVAGTVGIEPLLNPQAAINVKQPVMPTDELLGDPRWENLVRELMTEVVAAANALGLNIAPQLADKLRERTRNMGAYKASTLIDFERNQPLELESMFFEPLRQAQRAGVQTRRLTALCAVLRQIDPARQGRLNLSA